MECRRSYDYYSIEITIMYTKSILLKMGKAQVNFIVSTKDIGQVLKLFGALLLTGKVNTYINLKKPFHCESVSYPTLNLKNKSNGDEY